ncbi:HypC/HybG/HupF family hydrogenase formation chaperone [Phaeovibrio sulfidiphilus]|uniref:HypC/HybG/HupF family hydrogenase formation chaperone n=1 Tax=Phaeovibrio sulfidiphilus TaxID=1220600 RepID=A0A8J6YKV2_9PROT|nr:HypC/HybG/HupF family hydrogenase formation chaperone [Phaeovibrio sulfidiphilus]MBE1236490.1 HypC/HybG/HupF family hydrogenase formation chaperone [Phaeovibrio sulfidiphilus]
MCVGIPMQVLEDRGPLALCRDRGGNPVLVDMRLSGAQHAGTWVMTFAGTARSVMDPDTARKTLDALEALDTLMAGGSPDLEMLFADLVGRTPELPEFLRPMPGKDTS